jgi:serine/threonine protein kinase
MHRDLKLENIICKENKEIVIIDFGFACKIDAKDSVSLT